MKHLEMKKKVLGLIEELNPNNEHLTDDADIETKYIEVTNQILFELARIKKIPKYLELKVSKDDLITFEKIEQACGYEVYQIDTASGVNYVSKANGTVLKILESGTLELDVFIYPERVTVQNSKSYEFELGHDVLEIMPYGIAGDLLKSDQSAEHGRMYSSRYEQMLQRLDPRNQMPTIFIEGGVDI